MPEDQDRAIAYSQELMVIGVRVLGLDYWELVIY